jgi:hypothetical protein
LLPEGVDAPVREGDARCRLCEVPLELESSESERFDGRGRDVPGKLIGEEEEEDDAAETDDLCSRNGAERECIEEEWWTLFTIRCRWSNSFRCLGMSGRTGG